MAVVVYVPSRLSEDWWEDLPIPGAGDDGKAITYDHGTGTFVYAAAGGSGSPGGSTTQVQYNNAGAFGGDAGMTYDAANDRLFVAGRIGVGVAPIYPLHVIDNGGSGILLERTSATARKWLHYIGADGSYHIYDATAPAERFLIDTSGNWAVGIGTANNRLTVSGSADISGRVGVGITAPLSPLHVIDNGGNGIKLERTSGPARKWIQLIGSNGFWHFYDETDGRFTLTADTNGRLWVGDGTTAPTAQLDVAASTTTRASLRARLGVRPTSPNDGDLWAESDGWHTYFSGVEYILNMIAA